jgi:hypothetical protein
MGAGVYGGAAWIVLEQQRKEREWQEKARKKDERDRAADRVDGYDRDDLDESPDY